MNTGGRHTDQHITICEIFSRNHIFLIRNTHSKTGQIVIFFGYQSRMLCCLTADQGSLRLKTAFGNTFYDICDLFRIILAAGNVIQEKQRLTAGAGDIVYTHSHGIYTDGIMLIHNDGQFYFSTASVCSGQKYRLFHLFDLCQRKCTGESAQTAQHFFAHCFFNVFFHQLY